MKTITPKRGFTAYPNGTETHFAAGDPREVSNALADLLEEKGLVTVDSDISNENSGRKSGAETASEKDPETAD